jgi:hypothetical protein
VQEKLFPEFTVQEGHPTAGPRQTKEGTLFLDDTPASTRS